MGEKLTQIRGLVRRKKSVAGGKKGVGLKFGLKCNRDAECFLYKNRSKCLDMIWDLVEKG